MKVLDVLDVTVADSWVVDSNKAESGHGEAKIYIGSRTDKKYRAFFGPSGFELDCFLDKTYLIEFLRNMNFEYSNPSFDYKWKEKLPTLWEMRLKEVESQSDSKIKFRVQEQSHLKPPRGYINSNDLSYKFLRELPLPGISFLKILKIENRDGSVEYEFRLTVDRRHQEFVNQIRELELNSNGLDSTVVRNEVNLRRGQMKFRAAVLKECKSVCAFTLVRDPNLLLAGHIKPWAVSNDEERLDPQNGFAFSPTYDKLFNDGLISFSNKSELLVSSENSENTRDNLGLIAGMVLDVPLDGIKNARRRDFLAYHREYIFRI